MIGVFPPSQEQQLIEEPGTMTAMCEQGRNCLSAKYLREIMLDGNDISGSIFNKVNMQWHAFFL